MRSKSFKILTIIFAVVFFTFLAGAVNSFAQSSNWEREQRRYEKQQRKAAQQQQRRERQDQVYGRRNNDVGHQGGMNQAVEMGYQQGYQAGQYDRRKGKYAQSNVYRDSGGAYPNSGDPSAPDYYYRQGYIRGYEDGYHGVYR